MNNKDCARHLLYHLREMGKINNFILFATQLVVILQSCKLRCVVPWKKIAAERRIKFL